MRLTILALTTVATSALTVHPASAQSITYVVKQTIGTGGVTGQVTTDGTNGTLASSNITGWNLVLTGANNATYTLTNSNSSVVVLGGATTATPQNINFNYAQTGESYLLFQNGLYTGQHYWCNSSALGACRQGATVAPNSAVADPTAIFESRSGVQALGTANVGPINVTTIQALYQSFYDLARSQQAQMITANLFAKQLLGKNDQISCGDCGSAGISFGSLSVSAHGRKALTPALSALFGFAIGHYQEKGAYISDSYTFVGGLRYDPAGHGASRPYFEIGGAIAPGQKATYQRAYATGTGVATGSGSTVTGNYSAYVRAGWAARLSPRDELGGSVSIGHSWQTQRAYAETSNAANPFDAQFGGGTSQSNMAGISGQYTHLLGRRIEVAVDATVSRSFGSARSVVATVAGYGPSSIGAGELTYVEPGARIGFRANRRIKIDGFINATIAGNGIGTSKHGGFAFAYTF